MQDAVRKQKKEMAKSPKKWYRAAQDPIPVPVLTEKVQDDMFYGSQAIRGMMREQAVKRQRYQQATAVWRKEGIYWKADPILDENGKEKIFNLGHGANVLTDQNTEFPPYTQVRTEHIFRGIKNIATTSGMEVMNVRRDHLKDDIQNEWAEIMVPLELSRDKVDRTFDIIKVVSEQIDPSPSMKQAYEFAVEVRRQFEKVVTRQETAIKHFNEFLTDPDTTEARRRAVGHLMLQMKNDGVGLYEGIVWKENEEKNWRAFMASRAEIFNLTKGWQTNIRDDLAAKAFLVKDRKELAGVPQYVLEDAALAARLSGYPRATTEAGPWKVHFDDAMMEPMLKHATDRTFREYIYGNRKRVAFLGGIGPRDNTEILVKFFKLRIKKANILKYPTFADMAFVDKMATKKQVYAFLGRLRRESLPLARKEVQELRAFARERSGEEATIDHFDAAFWRERLLEDRFGLREGYIRPFFQFPVVLEALFALVHKLFGVDIKPEIGHEVWDEHVQTFRVRDSETGAMLGAFFLDAYRRRGKKKQGFWVQRIYDYSVALGVPREGPRLPAVHVVGDVQPPGADGKPAVMSMEQVAKLFHTFGGALRNLLCNQEEGLVSGTKGMEPDFQPLTPHLLERFAWDEHTIRSMSRHVQTGEVLPEAAIQTLAASRTFHGALRALRRTMNAQVLLDLHEQWDPEGSVSIYDFSKMIEAEFSAILPRVEDHELCGLALHDEEFAGGAYADLWGEALAADVFTEFEAAGLDNDTALREVGLHYREAVLAPGGGRAPMNSLRDFLGRAPAFLPMMKHLGLADDKAAAPAADGDGESSAAHASAMPDGAIDYEQYQDVYEDDEDYIMYEGEEPEYDDAEEKDEEGFDEDNEPWNPTARQPPPDA